MSANLTYHRNGIYTKMLLSGRLNATSRRSTVRRRKCSSG